MEKLILKYKIKKATEQDVYLHLMECSNNFFPPLSKSVNIKEYSKKIFENAVTFEKWSENKLIALIATYFDYESNLAFITNVSVNEKYLGKGIARDLMKGCLKYVKDEDLSEVKLEVNKNNDRAIILYEKFNFEKYGSEGDMDLMKLKI